MRIVVKQPCSGTKEMISFIDQADFSTLRIEECGKVTQKEKWNLTKHAHHTIEMLYFVEAKARINMASKVLYGTLGDIVIYPPGHMHEEQVGLDTAHTCMYLRFDLKSQCSLTTPFQVKDKTNKMYWLFNELVEIYEMNESLSDKRLMTLYIEALMLNIKQNLELSMEENLDLVEGVKHYINKNYQEELTVNKLAQQFFVSPSYLSRRFVYKKGISPMQYVIKVRIEQAKKLLGIKEIPITEIASLVGVNDPKYFSRLFKKETNYTPSQFRKIYIDSSEKSTF